MSPRSLAGSVKPAWWDAARCRAWAGGTGAPAESVLNMARPDVLDFTKLLAPIPGDNPAGADLRADASGVSDFYVIRDARKAASDAERRQDQGDVTATPEWR